MADMNQMLQAIIGLGQMQLQKREQALREQQYQTTKEQFAQSFGLQQGDQRFREVSKILDAITNAHADQRDALVKLGGALGLDQQTTDQLAQYAHNAPQTIQMLQTIAANQGYANAAPADRARMNAEAASSAVTGMNQGQAAASGVQSAALGAGQVAPGTFTPNVTASLQQGLGIRGATGQDPLAYNIGQVISRNPALLSAMAKIQAGTGVSAAEASQIATQRRGQDVQGQLGMYGANINLMDLASRTALQSFSARAGGMVTPGDRLKALSEMRAVNTSSQNLKTKEQENNATTLWNGNVMVAFPELAMPISQGGLMITSAQDFKTPGLLDRAQALVDHSMATQAQGGPQPGATPYPFQPSPTFAPPSSFQYQQMPQQGPPGVPPTAMGGVAPFNFMQFMQQLPAYQPPR